jgi:hypothetical protein
MHVRRVVRIAAASVPLVAVACAQVWGIGDVPTPVDAAADAATDAARADAADAADAADGAISPLDSAAIDTSTTLADSASSDTSRPDAPLPDSTITDSTTPDSTAAQDSTLADREPTPDAGIDAPIDGGCPTDPCTMATGLDHPYLMTSDDQNVYWTEFGDMQGSGNGTVKSCSVSGCGAGANVIASGLTNPKGIAVDGTNVYFGTDTFSSVGGGIWYCPLAGCGQMAPTMLAPAVIPEQLAVDQTYVYWVDSDVNSVNRVAKTGAIPDGGVDGGSPYALYSGSPLSIPTFCAVDGASIYVGDLSQNVFRLPLAGGTPVAIAVGNNGGSCPVVLDPNDVYYVTGGDICRASKTSTDGGPAIATGIRQVVGLAIDLDAGNVYWVNAGTLMANDGTLGKVGVDGGPTFNLGTLLASPEAIALSGSHLFWLSSGTLVDGGGTTAPSTGTLIRQAK